MNPGKGPAKVFTICQWKIAHYKKKGSRVRMFHIMPTYKYTIDLVFYINASQLNHTHATKAVTCCKCVSVKHCRKLLGNALACCMTGCHVTTWGRHTLGSLHIMRRQPWERRFTQTHLASAIFVVSTQSSAEAVGSNITHTSRASAQTHSCTIYFETHYRFII